MLEEASQANPIVRQMRFLPNDHNVIFASLLVHLNELLSGFHAVSRTIRLQSTELSMVKLHECYANHPKPDDDHLLSFLWRPRILRGILLGVMAVDGYFARLQAWGGVCPRHRGRVSDPFSLAEIGMSTM